MSLTTFADLVFAAGVGLAAVALGLAALRRGGTWLLAALVALEGAGAVGIWVAFALKHGRPLAVAAGGLTGCLLAATAALLLRFALRRVAAMDDRLDEAQADLLALVEQEKATRGSELELTLARARADSRSLLEEQERQLAEERRSVAEQRERDAMASLSARLVEAQAQVEQRLAAWAQDLDRAAEASKARIADLRKRQEQLLGEVEQRLLADAERLSSESEEQRSAVGRLRSDIDRTLEEALALVRSELDTHASERRRALSELESRLTRRERELTEQAQREEAEAVQRIRASFEDVARRQVEQLDRAVERAVASYAAEAAQQFAGAVKSAREDAAKRLARELDRSVSTFAREAETVLAEKLAHVGDAGAQRLERKITDVTNDLAHRQEEVVAAQEQRLGELESELRRKVDELHADIDAERGVLEARVQELLRRLPSAAGVADA